MAPDTPEIPNVPTYTENRELTSHQVNVCNEGLTIEVLDEPGPGGANHLYGIRWTGKDSVSRSMVVSFQNGPIGEAGINGVTHEALLAILEDRLVGFQNGPYACEANCTALYYIREAMQSLRIRTTSRVAQGIEGTMVVGTESKPVAHCGPNCTGECGTTTPKPTIERE